MKNWEIRAKTDSLVETKRNIFLENRHVYEFKCQCEIITIIFILIFISNSLLKLNYKKWNFVLVDFRREKYKTFSKKKTQSKISDSVQIFCYIFQLSKTESSL